MNVCEICDELFVGGGKYCPDCHAEFDYLDEDSSLDDDEPVCDDLGDE